MTMRQRTSPKARSSPLCPTTPGGLPVALLVERPRRRRLPRALALAALIVAVAVPGYGRVHLPAPHDLADAPGEPGPGDDRAHVGIWAATFAGAGVLARSAPQLPVDSDGPTAPERGRRFRALAALLARAEARGPLSPAPDAEVSVPGMRALSLAGERTVALWLLAPRDGYGSPVVGARVALRGVTPGRWRVTWVDDASGEAIATEERDVEGAGAAGDGRTVLAAPPFVRHVAAIVERVE